MPTLSEAMLQRKIEATTASGADTVIMGDASCMTQIAGGLKRAGSSIRVRHIAQMLT